MTAGLTLSAGGAAFAVDTDGVGIRPSTEADFFHLSLSPGSATDVVAVVSNHTGQAQSLLVYPVDAVGTPQGAFAFASQEARPSGVGAWVTSRVREITVAPGTERWIPFRLAVPSGTSPGDYAGGLVIQKPPQQARSSDTSDGTSFKLDIVQRQAVRIYLQVPGVARPSWTVEAPHWEQEGDQITFTVRATNTGTTILHPAGDLLISGWPISDGRLSFPQTEVLLPGASVDLRTVLRQAPAAQFGTAKAVLASEAGSGTGTAPLAYVSWLILAAACGALGILGFLAWRVLRFVQRAREALGRLASADDGAQ